MPPSSARVDRRVPSLAGRARGVRLLLLDVDGVLTDGRLRFLPGGPELMVFHVRDGAGIALARMAGLELGLLSARRRIAVARRARELGIRWVAQGVSDKLAAGRALARRAGFHLAQTSFAGDDLLDLPLMRAVGLAAAPADAVAEVRSRAHYVCRAGGGQGAVRELVELLLRAQGRWSGVVRDYLRGAR
jgi:3-deoxy-D-manno-octulosonate 8-phosphate phosphatase (KDO 8-P phosphatase)